MLRMGANIKKKKFVGEPVAVMHGANAPLLQRMIEKEIRKERQVLKGEATRDIITLEEAVPGQSY